jgi:hypothetical protein
MAKSAVVVLIPSLFRQSPEDSEKTFITNQHSRPSSGKRSRTQVLIVEFLAEQLHHLRGHERDPAFRQQETAATIPTAETPDHPTSTA